MLVEISGSAYRSDLGQAGNVFFFNKAGRFLTPKFWEFGTKLAWMCGCCKGILLFLLIYNIKYNNGTHYWHLRTIILITIVVFSKPVPFVLKESHEGKPRQNLHPSKAVPCVAQASTVGLANQKTCGQDLKDVSNAKNLRCFRVNRGWYVPCSTVMWRL